MFQQKGKIKKALKPSQRESITEFSDRFGSASGYEEREKKKRIISIVFIIAGVLLLVAAGYFFTDVVLKISEMPL